MLQMLVVVKIMPVVTSGTRSSTPGVDEGSEHGFVDPRDSIHPTTSHNCVNLRERRIL